MKSSHLSKNLQIALGIGGGLFATSMFFAPVFLSRMTVEQGGGSRLRATASEFVPKSRLRATAPEFVPNLGRQGGVEEVKIEEESVSRTGGSSQLPEADSLAKGGGGLSTTGGSSQSPEADSLAKGGGGGRTSWSSVVKAAGESDRSWSSQLKKGGSGGGGSGSSSLSQGSLSATDTGLRKSTLQIPQTLEELQALPDTHDSLTSEYGMERLRLKNIDSAISSLTRIDEKSKLLHKIKRYEDDDRFHKLERLFDHIHLSLRSNPDVLSKLGPSERELFSHLKDHLIAKTISRIQRVYSLIAAGNYGLFDGHLHAILIQLQSLKSVDEEAYYKFQPLMKEFCAHVKRDYLINLSSRELYGLIKNRLGDDFQIERIGQFEVTKRF
jgi:hypothetical protein